MATLFPGEFCPLFEIKSPLSVLQTAFFSPCTRLSTSACAHTDKIGQNTSAVVFFVDSADRERLAEARDELVRVTAEAELDGVPVLLFCNKQDLDGALSPVSVSPWLCTCLPGVSVHLVLCAIKRQQHATKPVFYYVRLLQGEIEAVFLGDGSEEMNGHRFSVLGGSAKNNDNLSAMLDWIVDATSTPKADGRRSSTHAAAAARAPATEGAATSKETAAQAEARRLEETMMEWLQREDQPDDVFLTQLSDYTLDSWDHRTHLRIAWLLLRQHGRRDGLTKIFDSIRAFIENSPRTHRSRGTTFHETMTYFWVHMVHYAIEATSNPDDTFKTFLLMNPQLVNGGLFLHFYSKKLMLQTADARTAVVLPDLKPLPSLLSAVDAAAGATAVEANLPPRSAPLSDEDFLAQWEAQTLKGWGHEVKLRAIWLCLREGGRRDGMARAFKGLKAIEGDAHSVTESCVQPHLPVFPEPRSIISPRSRYFWVQMVDYATAKARQSVASFGEFIQLPTSQSLRNALLIDKYYTQQMLQEGKAEFVLPDRKPLPSVVS